MTIRVAKLSLMAMVAGLMLILTGGTVLAKDPKNVVFVIGDSLSDPGNLFRLTGGFPPSPYAERFSNGPVWAEYLSADRGITTDNRAFGGAFTGHFLLDKSVPVSNYNDVQYPSLFQGLPGVSEEIDRLLADYLKGLNPKALYVIWAGANDFFLGLEPTENSGEVLAQTAANIADDVCRLGTAGARHFVVGNMTDIGLTPFAKELGTVIPDAQIIFSQTIAGFNIALTEVLNNLPSACAETVQIWDTYQAQRDIVADPAAFGLTNTTDACLTDTICPTPDEYLFWDSVHPTTAVHAIMAENFRATVCNTDEDPHMDKISHSKGSKHYKNYWHSKNRSGENYRCWDHD